MSRPFGSKNKPKTEVPCLSQKESSPPTVAVVEKQRKRVSSKKIPSTISPATEVGTLSSGVGSVDNVSIALEAAELTLKSMQKQPMPTKIVKGYVNIMKSKTGYYTGCDIHPTVEKAKAIACKGTITQVYIAFEVPL